ncbi:DUF58 domain-containing protein [Candidatus Woesearchaeota archaeon]|nr:DUF58 domain-containing protein [Candidatus Woesearchaeota archaeon]|tara:strand:- start:13681 stop:14526 length:846 start_codon:yes stop_codon:yes gene_type:complete
MITADFLGELDRFHLILSKRVTSKYFGNKASINLGSGSTLKDHRIYSEGDDFRQIDWKIYARTDHLYIKKYEEERNMTVHVIVDDSASMNYGKPKKFDYASMLGVGFAYLSLKEHERFQFATFSDSLDVFQPRRGLEHVATMIDHLNKVKIKGKSKFFDAMAKYSKLLGTKSLIIIISDFLLDPEEVKEGLLKLGNHDIKLVQVLDPSEKELEISGDVKLEDAETHEILRTYVSPRLISQYESQLGNHVSNLNKTCLDLKADFFLVTTNTPIFDVFYRILS